MVINFYLSFVGNTSRQIGNVYIGIQELIHDIMQSVTEVQEGKIALEEQYLGQIYQKCRYFLCMAIHSNHQLSRMVDNVNEFVDEVFFLEYNQWKMYMNYTFLNDYLESRMKKENKEDKIEMGLQLYSLLVFVENILLILESKTDYGITGRKKVSAVPFLAKYVSNVAFEKRHVFRDDLKPDTFFIHYFRLLDKLPNIVADEMSEVKFNLEYFYNFREYKYDDKKVDVYELLDMYRKNRKWFKELTGMLSMVYGNAYLVDQAVIDECMIYSDERCKSVYQIQIDSIIKNELKGSFVSFNLRDIPQKMEKVSLKEEDNYTFITKIQSTCKERLMKKLQDSIKLQKESGKLDIAEENIGKETEDRYKKYSYVALRDIVKIVYDESIKYIDSHNCFTNIDTFLAVCPDEIVDDMKDRGLNHKSDRKDILELMQKYVNQVTRFDYAKKYHILIYDIEACIQILTRLRDTIDPFRRQLNELLQLLYQGARQKAEDEQMEQSYIYDISWYLNFKKYFNLVYEYLAADKGEKNIYDDEASGDELVSQFLSNVDLCVDLEKVEDVRAGVNMGLSVVFIAYLQKLYLHQTIVQRYDNKNSYSSVELEQVGRKGANKNTYYYSMYNLMKDIVEEKVTYAEEVKQKHSNIEDPEIENKVAWLERELTNLRRIIEDTYIKERQNYLDDLFLRCENE